MAVLDTSFKKKSRRSRPWVVGLMLAMSVLLAACGSDDDFALELSGSIDDSPLSEATPGSPIRLEPFQESDLTVSITNTSDSEVTVDHLRLEGEMLDLTFVAYDSGVALVVPGNTTREITVPLDFFDLDRQAHGFLRAKLKAYDEDRTVLGSKGFAVDVRGRPLSIMGSFALLLVVFTVLSLITTFYALARRTLPANRFQRALRFMVCGLGIGLLLSVAFSLLRIFPLPTSTWIPLVLIPTAIGFAFGYATPGPDDDPTRQLSDDDIDELIDIDAVDAAASANKVGS